MLLALGRQNKLQGISDQIKYTLRDESSHIAFGTYLINTLIEQNPDIWTKEIQEEFVSHIKKAVELEIAYAHDVLPTGILGLNAEMFVDYMHYIGNRRLEAIGLDYRFLAIKTHSHGLVKLLMFKQWVTSLKEGSESTNKVGH